MMHHFDDTISKSKARWDKGRKVFFTPESYQILISMQVDVITIGPNKYNKMSNFNRG